MDFNWLVVAEEIRAVYFFIYFFFFGGADRAHVSSKQTRCWSFMDHIRAAILS